MNGNPICVQIPWDKNAEALAKWANVCFEQVYCACKCIKTSVFYLNLKSKIILVCFPYFEKRKGGL
jgi:hypothetical protein